MSTNTTDQKEGSTSKGVIRAYQKVFKSKEGKIVLAHLNELFSTGTQAFQLKLDDDSGKQAIFKYDPIHAALKDGARGVMLHIEGIRDTAVKPDDEPDKKVKVTK